MEYFKIDLLNDKLTPLLPKITQNLITIHLTKNIVNYEIRDKEFSIMFTNRLGQTFEINSLEGGSISLLEGSKICLNLSKDIIKYNGLLNCEMIIRNKDSKEFIDRAIFIIMILVDTSLLKEMQSDVKYETLEQLLNKVDNLDDEFAKNIEQVFAISSSDLSNQVNISKQTINTSVSTAIEEIDNKVNNVYQKK
ncbi:hypothetical protein [Cetobacterium sp.]|uniref:hypothetical protein n=1 Tax=Cetobacterium sp. TaxID=2071632 RepID=UPI003F2DC088